jgi:hypothetical protein
MTGGKARPAAPDAPTWAAVSAERPCPCCGQTAGCGTAEETAFVHCRLRVSSRPIAGGGWLHVLARPGRAERPPAGRPARPVTRSAR